MAGAGEQAQASSGGGVGYYLFPKVAELEEQVQAIRLNIEGAGIRPLPFSVADINGTSLTTRRFFKYAETFTNIASMKDEAQRSQVHAAAAKDGTIADVSHVSLREFVNLCEWLKSAAGRDALQVVPRRRKLARKLRASGDHVGARLALAVSYMASKYQAEAKKACATLRLGSPIYAGRHKRMNPTISASVAVVSERPGGHEDGEHRED